MTVLPNIEPVVTVPSVFQAWNAAMRDVGAVAKKDRNDQQKFNFRGIDAVMNAVGPALRDHGIMVIPVALDMNVESYATKTGTAMKNVTVQMQYTVYGPAGDTMIGSTYGEAADSGDKAVSKAQSVAYRTFLLQSFTMPTDEKDPDAESHEREPANPTLTPVQKARVELKAVLDAKGIDPTEASAKFATNGHGSLGASTDIQAIRELTSYYKNGASANGVV